MIRPLTPLHSVDLLVVREGEQAYVERQGSVRVPRAPPHEAGLRSQDQLFAAALHRPAGSRTVTRSPPGRCSTSMRPIPR